MKFIAISLGFIFLLLAWVLLPTLGESFTFHMVQHMTVVALASGAIALGLNSTSLDPSGKFPAVFSPIPVSILELIVVWGWHAPMPHHLARSSSVAFFFEQFSFFIVGLWLWLSALRNREAGVIGLLLTSMHMTFLGALLGMAPRSLYAHHSSLEDLHMGGAIMVVLGGFTYLCGGIFLTLQILREKYDEKLA